MQDAAPRSTLPVAAVPFQVATPAGHVSPSKAEDGFDPLRWVSILLRRWKLFVAVALLVFAAVLMVTTQATPLYTATASLMVQPKPLDVIAIQAGMGGGMPEWSNEVDTRVLILKSRGLAQAVATQLGLQNDEEFAPKAKPHPGPLAVLMKSISSSRPTPPPAERPSPVGDASPNGLRPSTVGALMGAIAVKREATTFVINISATSQDPQKAALIANTLADLSIVEDIKSRENENRESNEVAERRLQDLRGQVEAADVAVDRYKIEHNLMSTAGGGTIAEQQVNGLNQQIATAEAERSEKEARVAAAKEQIARGGGGSDVGDVLSSGTIVSLRRDESDAARNLAELKLRYGDKYPEVQKYQGQLAAIQLRIKEETARIISSLEGDASIARQRVASLRASQNAARNSLVSDNSAQAGLLELQRRALTIQTVYDAFLTRSKQTAALEGATPPGAIVINRAQAPGGPSSPNLRLAIAFGLTAGLVAGLASVVLLEMFTTGVRSGDEVEAKLGLPFAGSVPTLKSTLPTGKTAGLPQDHLVDHPFSAFAESIRSLRTFLMLSGADAGPPRVIAITSALPREGKSMTAFCLARIMGLAGTRVVLVDCDLRRRGVSQMISTNPVGLVEVLSGKAQLDAALVEDKRSGATILPTLPAQANTRDIFATQAMEDLIEELSRRFDVVILDTAPTLAIADTRMLASRADATLLLNQWNKTPVKASDAALDLLIESGARVVGVALSQVNLREQSRYGYGDRNRYHRAYASYYSD